MARVANRPLQKELAGHPECRVGTLASGQCCQWTGCSIKCSRLKKQVQTKGTQAVPFPPQLPAALDLGLQGAAQDSTVCISG